MSKARSVVAQTYTNFSGGKYSELVDGFRVINIQNINPELLSDGTTPLLLMTTTGLFNNKEQSEGALNIYKKDNDLFGEQSPWQRLIERLDGARRRPLVIVYDEGHNLSEQQTDLLSELSEVRHPAYQAVGRGIGGGRPVRRSGGTRRLFPPTAAGPACLGRLEDRK